MLISTSQTINYLFILNSEKTLDRISLLANELTHYIALLDLSCHHLQERLPKERIQLISRETLLEEIIGQYRPLCVLADGSSKIAAALLRGFRSQGSYITIVNDSKLNKKAIQSAHRILTPIELYERFPPDCEINNIGEISTLDIKKGYFQALYKIKNEDRILSFMYDGNDDLGSEAFTLFLDNINYLLFVYRVIIVTETQEHHDFVICRLTEKDLKDIVTVITGEKEVICSISHAVLHTSSFLSIADRITDENSFEEIAQALEEINYENQPLKITPLL